MPPKSGVARLAGVEAPSSTDNEGEPGRTAQRIRKTIEFVLRARCVDRGAREDKDVTAAPRRGKSSSKGEFYLKHYVQPELLLPVTTAYALLRHNGVGRRYLGALVTLLVHDLTRCCSAPALLSA